MRRTSPLILMLLLPLAACGPTINADFNSAEPAARNAAIVEAAKARNKSAVPDLVRMLDSDDPATRLLAIDALERITGERMGYDYTAPEYERAKAVDQWQAYAAEHSPRSSGPTSSAINLPTSSSHGGAR